MFYLYIYYNNNFGTNIFFLNQCNSLLWLMVVQTLTWGVRASGLTAYASNSTISSALGTNRNSSTL